jgi:fructose 1,6-bisphosphatase
MAQEAKFTLSVIKADIGSVAGHNRPHPDLLKQAEERLAAGGEERARPYLAALDREKS